MSLYFREMQLLTKKLLIIPLVCASLGLMGQSKLTPQQYVDTYRDYAIIEMHRGGVPASITLAQGMLESSYGNSRLATQGNNHFGIKCKESWKGATIYADDDAPNECFRAYNTALESFRDHSDFLRQNWRYHELFDLKITDYRGWAEGLRKAGYATNTSYHTILISLIEKYQLYQYDLAPMPGEQQILVTSHQVPMVYAGKDESLETIARRNELTMNQIYKYNDMGKGGKVSEGDPVYLKPKRRRGTEKYHIVEEGENLYQISQAYGIKLKHLYSRNHLESGTEVAAGEKVYMQGKRSKSDSLETLTPEQKVKEKEQFINPHSMIIEKAPPIEKEIIEVPEYHVIQSGDNIYRIAEKYHVFEEDLLKWNNINALQLTVGKKIYLSEAAAKAAGKFKSTTNSSGSEVKQDTSKLNTGPLSSTPSEVKYHVVEKGETVYRICTKYGISSEQLQKWNNLKGNDIFAGQKLKIAE